MVWSAGVGPWWAATAEIFKITSGSDQPLRAQTDSTNNELLIKLSHSDLRGKASIKGVTYN
jgi:hypothetical protein